MRGIIREAAEEVGKEVVEYAKSHVPHSGPKKAATSAHPGYKYKKHAGGGLQRSMYVTPPDTSGPKKTFAINVGFTAKYAKAVAAMKGVTWTLLPAGDVTDTWWKDLFNFAAKRFEYWLVILLVQFIDQQELTVQVS